MIELNERDQATLRRAAAICERIAKYETAAPLASPGATADYLKYAMIGRQREEFHALYLDSQHAPISFDRLFQGTLDGAAIYPREVVKAALKHNAAAVIFAHNHPSGIAEPSQADRRITERLQAALLLVDVRVLDHIIVGATGNTFSFAERGLI
jgi:DNA repair protein RadC